MIFIICIYVEEFLFFIIFKYVIKNVIKNEIEYIYQFQNFLIFNETVFILELENKLKSISVIIDLLANIYVDEKINR